MKKRYKGTHQEFWLFFSRGDQRALASWAAHCAEDVLPYFEEKLPGDKRPREAIRTLREWIRAGEFSMAAIRSASLAAHAAARKAKRWGDAACFAARAAGQAVATAHVPTHALGSALYAVKAAAAGRPADSAAAAAAERKRQLARLPKNLKPWVIAWMTMIESRKGRFVGSKAKPL